MVFDEFMPEDMPPERQLHEVRQRCTALGFDPELAAVDRNDVEQIAAFKKLFRGTRVLDADSRELQSRKASVQALQRLIEPLDGIPKLLVCRHLTGPTASTRGVHASLQNVAWEWDRLHQCYLDIVNKDGTYDHAYDSVAYWAKLIGVDRIIAAVQRPIERVTGGASMDDLLRRLNIPGAR